MTTQMLTDLEGMTMRMLFTDLEAHNVSHTVYVHCSQEIRWFVGRVSGPGELWDIRWLRTEKEAKEFARALGDIVVVGEAVEASSIKVT